MFIFTNTERHTKNRQREPCRQTYRETDRQISVQTYKTEERAGKEVLYIHVRTHGLED